MFLIMAILKTCAALPGKRISSEVGARLLLVVDMSNLAEMKPFQSNGGIPACDGAGKASFLFGQTRCSLSTYSMTFRFVPEGKAAAFSRIVQPQFNRSCFLRHALGYVAQTCCLTTRFGVYTEHSCRHSGQFELRSLSRQSAQILCPQLCSSGSIITSKQIEH